MRILNYIFFTICFAITSCGKTQNTQQSSDKTIISDTTTTVIEVIDTTIYPGAYSTNEYLSTLTNKKVGVVVNPSSQIEGTHLVDTLLSNGIQVESIFAPEHGFRGTADAGEVIKNGIDSKSGLPVISLYGDNKKPTANQVENLDVIIFDIQDVGVRFYTYISTMHYIMESCAENNIELIILDRPNPNGDYVAGPIRDPNWKSFVGMHPIPIVHGLTVGELANMINDEGWLSDSVKCNLKVIPCNNYTHQKKYELPVKPSPNLPNYNSIRLYPSLCLLEPTQISVGRGTYFPFEVLGSTEIDTGFCFTPTSIDGMSKYPKHENKECCGQDFRSLSNAPKFTLKYLYDYYQSYPDKEKFYVSRNFFNKIAGTDQLANLLEKGATYEEFTSWYKADLDNFKILRKQYLLYPDNTEK